MSFQIEFLKETTEENSVCYTVKSKGGTLDAAEQDALAIAERARRLGATGFQIRHLNAVDRVVTIVDFHDRAPVGD
jgi:hypothetical protein